METRTLAFEIGTEEIPAFDLSAAVKQLQTLVPRLLDDAAIPHGDVEIFCSPRRLIVLAHDLPEATEAKSEVFKGPSAKIAFDENGEPTKAALGFARGKGVDAKDLVVETVDGVDYVFAKTQTPSVAVKDLLSAVLDGIVRGINWPKSQRWGSESEYFSRPIRWFVALFGEELVDFMFAGLTADRLTYGHRFLAPGPFEVSSADDLLQTARDAYVVPSEAEREAVIRQGVADIEEKTGLTATLPHKTLVEVINLTEYPTVVMGTFDEEFLEVPEEIIVDAMLMHQRYFPLYNNQGKLTNKFLVVSNGDPAYSETIIDGNERVVRARLFDAKFFYDEDLKQPLEAYVDRLSDVVFQEKLGTMLDKTRRIEALVGHLVEDANLDAENAADALRAARLCKADLVTSAVIEFTSVQGVMGSYYALASGENAQVAQAIEQHYQPRFAGDNLPETTVGQLVALADKLDTVCGLFAIDQGPTGSSDPFSVRRSAIGIINMLMAGLPISLDAAIACALKSFDFVDFDSEAVLAAVKDFFITRTKVILKDNGASPDAIDAVLACGVSEPAIIASRVQALETIRNQMPETMDNLATAFARANNLRDEAVGVAVNADLFIDAESALDHAIEAANQHVEEALSQGNYEAALQALADLRDPIDTFFEEVMIMDEDEAKRTNRLALLNRFVAVFAHIADFSALSK